MDKKTENVRGEFLYYDKSIQENNCIARLNEQCKELFEEPVIL